jgi:hypothetical protein
MTDLPTLLAELDALYAEWSQDVSSPALHEQWKATLLVSWPQLREALRSLQWEVAAAAEQADALVRECNALRALVAQQREALQSISEHLPCDHPCKMVPAQGRCGECGAYRFETWCAGCTARAALATEEA